MSRIHPYLTNGRQSDQNVWEVTQSGTGVVTGGLHRVGTRAVLEDGRVFYYARSSGAAIVAGQMLQMPDQDTDFEDMATATDVVGSATVTPTQGGSATAVANEFAGGYISIISGTAGSGPGLTLPIASHAAWGATTALPLTLDAPLNVLFNADVKSTCTKNPWADVIISGANQDHKAVGVSNVAVPAGTTNPQHFWCQTWGSCSVWNDAATANGSKMASGTTAGQIEISGADGDQDVGQLMWLSTAEEYTPTFLTIAP